ncbi:MAG TPA: Nif3-like dinuclear metal center hexameric protein [Candidatus Acidoferrum sp.]|nr:Nif3-like dinuclear metal center hexameric protein [Candidatus Acidoferrum sp.]
MSNGSIRAGIALFFALASVAANSAAAQAKKLTAREVATRIQAHVGIPWMAETVDTFVAGDPDTEVKGIAVTMMATLDVLQRAASAGQNLIVTHEPTFFNHHEKIDDLELKENDPVLAAKRAFIREHKLVVWRFHDHWHRMKRDGIETGMARALGWESFQDSGNQYLFAIPETDLGHLAGDVKSRLGIRVLRVVGDPMLKVKKVAVVPGASGFTKETRALEIDDVQVLITGEPREWETVEYVADAVTEGKPKALIILGHIPSEQAGMEEATQWLKTFVSEVPVEFVPAREPFWEPKQ